MAAPLVAVSLSHGLWSSTGTEVDYLPTAYTRALATAGIIPLLIPSSVSPAALRHIYERVDGIMLSGGGDVHPQCSGFELGDPQAELASDIDDQRDSTEFQLVRWAYEDDKPLLGICRGHQALNVALGGTLLMDIPTLVGEQIQHKVSSHKAWRSQLLHTVEVQPHSRAATILGAGELSVNSIHHQALDRVAPNLCPTAFAPDGVIEVVEIPEARFFIGVQWHPEEIVEVSPPMRVLFQTFADALC